MHFKVISAADMPNIDHFINLNWLIYVKHNIVTEAEYYQWIKSRVHRTPLCWYNLFVCLIEIVHSIH